MSPIAVSVLDLLPVRTGQTTAQALDAARSLARAAEQAGVRRYWLAEHHNTLSVASTSPPVAIAMLAAATSRMRIGSGGVMLPNHAPLVVAEQFALLEAAYPGRIDLGIGRAPGTDPVTSWALRAGASDSDAVQRFPDYVQQVMAFMSTQGAAVQIGAHQHEVVATPHASHHEVVASALEAGLHVLVEKPLATLTEDSLRILEAEQAAGKKLITVGFMRRFDKGYQEMREALVAGDHGYATLVHCRHRNPSVPEGYTTRNMIDDTAIHEVDTSRYLLGEEIVRVRIDTPRSTSHRFEHLADPLVLVAYTESGVRIDDEVNVNIGFGYSIECELVMEQGTIRLSDQHRTVVRDGEGERNPICRSHIDRFHDAFNAEVQQWIRAVERDEHTGSSAWDGYAAGVVVDAAVRSLESGGVEVPVEMIAKPAFYN